MCLGVPAQVVAILDSDQALALADSGGVRRPVSLALLAGEGLEALVGQWVLLHVGFALARIDEREARQTLALLAKMGQEGEL
ncbi:HypC/HybG/HupF family hydrogenase formation chaperone [Gallaecimonas kandeliae]|uniref:HypC/HybG/HupF family hydrogenase formation chaperone n=1 Tax=Gallaecimonas kandeliae TaxID=3029055 RepID=UPI00264A3ECE|nr:HypC/HybG/HupF family hydrogenase formation chaperone [Gallaecimonas kandeliae]WKE64214.1 HypC/HybG/HupF family hydrogenase formation chaperone [Gallaecimonas kandeliae]